MANMAIVAGRVLRSEERSGTTMKGVAEGGTPRGYSIRTALVLVQDFGTAEVSFNDNDPLPKRGEEVCFAVEVSARGYLQCLGAVDPQHLIIKKAA